MLIHFRLTWTFKFRFTLFEKFTAFQLWNKIKKAWSFKMFAA